MGSNKTGRVELSDHIKTLIDYSNFNDVYALELSLVAESFDLENQLGMAETCRRMSRHHRIRALEERANVAGLLGRILPDGDKV